MARDIDFGNKDQNIPFNCYKSVVNDKGRLIKDNNPYERIYCQQEPINFSRTNINNSTRAVGYISTFITNSPNQLEEDFYIENLYTKEVWRIVSITKTPINQGNYEGSIRAHYQYRLEVTR